MKKLLLNYGYGTYLGGVLAVEGIGLTNWEFYLIIIPVVILVELKVKIYEKAINN